MADDRALQAVEAAVEYLATMGWLREQEPERPTRGRPSARFDVNPNIPKLPKADKS